MLLFQFFVFTFGLITKVAALDSQKFCHCFAAGYNFDFRCIFHVKEDVLVLELHVFLFVHL